MYKLNKGIKKNNRIIFLIIIIIIQILLTIISKQRYNNNKQFLDNFDYINYENYIITEEMEKNAGWMYMSSNQYFFINGIIRKHKPKNCLEVGVASGGSSVLILNAIKDIKESKLISLDLNTNLYFNNSLKTGYRVKQYFPELTKNWQLFTGEQPHVFLEKLQMKFDFVFLDTAHITPGEIINLIEVLPFLNENSIMILHDIVWHFYKERQSIKITSISSPTLLLLTALYGDKLIIKNNKGIDNMGAVFLYKDQKKHYLDYFLLLLNFWEYMPSEKQLEEIRSFIIKHYEDKQLLLIFEMAIKNNINYVKKLKKFMKKKK